MGRPSREGSKVSLSTLGGKGKEAWEYVIKGTQKGTISARGHPYIRERAKGFCGKGKKKKQGEVERSKSSEGDRTSREKRNLCSPEDQFREMGGGARWKIT